MFLVKVIKTGDYFFLCKEKIHPFCPIIKMCINIYKPKALTFEVMALKC